MALFDFRWPDQINLQIYGADQYVEYVASLIQLRQYSHAEALLLASSDLSQQSHQYLLALLQIRQSRVDAYRELSKGWPFSWARTIESKILLVLSHLRKFEFDEIKKLGEDFWNIYDSSHVDDQHQLHLVRAMAEFAIGRYEVSALLLQNLPYVYSSCFEAQLLQCRLLLNLSSMRQ